MRNSSPRDLKKQLCIEHNLRRTVYYNTVCPDCIGYYHDEARKLLYWKTKGLIKVPVYSLGNRPK